VQTENGLPRHGAGESPGPLDEDKPMVRLALGGFGVTEANQAFLAMVGRAKPAVVGHAWSSLCPDRERDAVHQRLDDVVVLGRDTISALALPRADHDLIWVEIEARYAWRGGERLELALRPLDGPQTSAEPASNGAAPNGAKAPQGESAAEEQLEDAEEQLEEQTEAQPEEPAADPPEGQPEGLVEVEDTGAVVRGDAEPASAWSALDEPVSPPEADPRVPQPSAAEDPVTERTSAWCDDTAGAVVAEGVTMADAAGVAALALAPGWRVVGATARAVQLCDARRGPADAADGGPHMKQLLRMADESFDSLEIARRDGRRQPAHAVAREQGADLMVEWVPGGRPGHGWLILDEPPGEDPTTTRLLQAEWHVYQVAHDARNQLAEIDAGLELLDEALAPAQRSDDQGSSSEVEPIGPAERERLHRTVELTRMACAAALEIIHDVHEQTEQAQRVRDLRKKVDLEELLRSTLAGYEPRAAARGVSISEAMTPSVFVLAEPVRLRRVLTNLFDNALQAMPEGGTLHVSTAEDDREAPGVLLDIADTGVGIAPERLERIFQPGETTTPGSKGRGLGIVHRFVLACHGEIRCESVLGEGTTFHIWLPRIV